MTLTDWIDDLGVKKVCELLEVERQTVYYWKELTCLPKPEIMRRIVKTTHGLVTYEEMIEPFFKRRADKE